MNRDEIIAMARVAGFVTGTRDLMDSAGSIQTVTAVSSINFLPELERLVTLAVGVEREACAALCEEDTEEAGNWSPSLVPGKVFARDIRARGDA